MTPALKDIGRIKELLGASALAESPLWERQVDRINTHAIYAFIGRVTDDGRRDMAETAIDIAVNEVKAAVDRGEFAAPQMLEYRRHERVYLTAGELRNGLRFARQPKAAAILFGLEMHLDAAAVEKLTWVQVARMARQGTLTTLANKCLLACPQQLRFEFVFWQHDDRGILRTLSGLQSTVFDAFGMTWLELESGYANLIKIDGAADRKSVEAHLRNQ